MRHGGQDGYIGLLGMVLVVGLIGLFYYIAYIRPSAGMSSATSTPTQVGQSSIEQDMNALQNSHAIQDMSAKRAAEINAEMK